MERESATRDIWVELRTNNERIEGIIRVPEDSRCRRIADLIWHADRGASGVLHLTKATVYDLKTEEVKFRKEILGINRQIVAFAAPLNGSAFEKPSGKIPAIDISQN
ncbi:MAG: hypothetical protein HY400_07330 [Elusimicrobia bacterium]|nr:hypothetical protein [Elusimicrobiota bacterium]